MNRLNVELQLPSMRSRTIQVNANDTQRAAYLALDQYPEATLATAWAPGGVSGLDRTDVAYATPALRAAERDEHRYTPAWFVLPWMAA